MADTNTESGNPLPAKVCWDSGRERTPRACARCRRQKLKCDKDKPCTLCKRAGIECEASVDCLWKPQLRLAYPKTKKRKRQHLQSEPGLEFNPTLSRPVPEREHLVDTLDNAGAARQPSPYNNEGHIHGLPKASDDFPNSSTLGLVKEAFDFHQSDDLATTATSSLPRGQLPRTPHVVNLGGASPDGTRFHRLYKNRTESSSDNIDRRHHAAYTVMQVMEIRRSRTVAALLDILPREQQALDLLIDTYFDRVHWFMLVFQQDTFRERYQTLISRPDIREANSKEDFSFACVLLTVTALGLQYTCAYRRQRLTELNIEPEALLSELLSTVQAVLFDLVAIGSLESVQVCVLFGSFCLFHGCPGPALPVIGCGLRIAQGMGLHRRRAQHNSKSPSGSHEAEEAKRCWLALFEIDRFCSMVYGLPISFENEDCDIERLVLSPFQIQTASSTSTPAPRRKSMLLLYKGYMSEFSMILTEILHGLYGSSPQWHKDGRPASFEDPQMQTLSGKINSLDQKLRRWYQNLNPSLHLEDAKSKQRAYVCPEAMGEDIGGSGERFELHILRMQAITLKFAFENAIIMIHRPLLSFRLASTFESVEMGTMMHNPYKSSIEACRKAALSIASIGSWPAFDEALDTYAASFIGIHIFAAAVVLCLIASYKPMSSQAHEAKAGIRELIAMQRQLQKKSVIASQGLEILEKVVSLVIERELEEVLGNVKPQSSRPRTWDHEASYTKGTHTRRRNMPVSDDHSLKNYTVEDNQASPQRSNPTVGKHVDLRDPHESQPQINIDTVEFASTNAADTLNFNIEDYHSYLGSFSTDIEQGWIWDPDWLASM